MSAAAGPRRVPPEDHDGAGAHAAHGHSHGPSDPSLFSSERGLWATKWSLIGLGVTAVIQLIVAYFSGSIGLLAETIHNFGDAGTALPLWAAFVLGRRRPTSRFTYGYGRVEDLAGVVVVLLILASAVSAGYESVQRLIHPQSVGLLWAVALASIVSFAGNELVALFRIRVGKEINSAALVADGQHARVDGIASLGVLVGAAGVWMGFPIADPLVGLAITVIILRAAWESGSIVFTRLLEGIDPEIVEEIRHMVGETPGVLSVGEVRARWLGHRLHAEVNLAVDPQFSVGQGHDVAVEAQHRLLRDLGYLSGATIHVFPEPEPIQGHRHGENEAHDEFGTHTD